MDHRSKRICSSARIALAAVALAAAPARADNPKRDAQALVTQGVHLLARKQYDDALEKFRAAYDRFPSPKILLNIGSTLRDMGRIAEAANTYQRYVDDDAADPARLGEVRQLLRDLDARLAVLVLDVTPSGAEVSIDGGPWVPVGGRMMTRVDPGAHVVRGRKPGREPAQMSIDARAGRRAEVEVTLAEATVATVATRTPPRTTPPPPPPPPIATRPPPPPIAVEPRANRVPERARLATEDVAPVIVDEPVIVDRGARTRERIDPLGLTVQSRLDGRLRGGAAAIGLVYDPAPALETELSALISQDGDGVMPGAYLGLRLRVGDRVRPFLGGGVPVFWSAEAFRVGVRGGAGVELLFTRHLTLLVDLGVEHFFNPQSTYDANLFVPIVGLEGHL